MSDKVKNILKEIKSLLEAGKEYYNFGLIKNILNSDEEELWNFLTSNELWGGAGSIADQALLDNKDLRIRLEKLLIKLGDIQIAKDRINIRTRMWIAAFKQKNTPRRH